MEGTELPDPMGCLPALNQAVGIGGGFAQQSHRAVFEELGLRLSVYFVKKDFIKH